MTTTLNILLVEDNPADVELVREALDATNLVHVLQVANDFEEAKQHMDSMLLGAPRPDVLLMDLNLPRAAASNFCGYFVRIPTSNRFQSLSLVHPTPLATVIRQPVWVPPIILESLPILKNSWNSAPSSPSLSLSRLEDL